MSCATRELVMCLMPNVYKATHIIYQAIINLCAVDIKKSKTYKVKKYIHLTGKRIFKQMSCHFHSITFQQKRFMNSGGSKLALFDRNNFARDIP